MERGVKNLTRLLVLVSFVYILCLPLLERPIFFGEKGLLAGGSSSNFRKQHVHLIESGLSLGYDLLESFRNDTSVETLYVGLKKRGFRVISSTPIVNTPQGHCTCHNHHATIQSQRGDNLEALVLVTPVFHFPNQGLPNAMPQSPTGAAFGISLGATLSSYLATTPWMARNLIWLLPDANCGLTECTSAWLNLYYGEDRESEQSNDYKPINDVEVPFSSQQSFFERSGVLQQAIVVYVEDLDLSSVGEEPLPPSAMFTTELLVEGFEGQLPKLDLFCLLRYLLQYIVNVQPHLWQSGDPVSLFLVSEEFNWIKSVGEVVGDVFKKVFGKTSVVYIQELIISVFNRLPLDWIGSLYMRKTGNILNFARIQIAGLPSGPHAAFKDFMVDAATVRIRSKNRGMNGGGRMEHLKAREAVLAEWKTLSSTAGLLLEGKVLLPQNLSWSIMIPLIETLELAFRSLNNLVERFHHSFFLYLLSDEYNFVSIERYIEPAVFCIIALVVQAYGEFHSHMREVQEREDVDKIRGLTIAENEDKIRNKSINCSGSKDDSANGDFFDNFSNSTSDKVKHVKDYKNVDIDNRNGDKDNMRSQGINNHFCTILLATKSVILCSTIYGIMVFSALTFRSFFCPENIFLTYLMYSSSTPTPLILFSLAWFGICIVIVSKIRSIVNDMILASVLSSSDKTTRGVMLLMVAVTLAGILCVNWALAGATAALLVIITEISRTGEKKSAFLARVASITSCITMVVLFSRIALLLDYQRPTDLVCASRPLNFSLILGLLFPSYAIIIVTNPAYSSI